MTDPFSPLFDGLRYPPGEPTPLEDIVGRAGRRRRRRRQGRGAVGAVLAAGLVAVLAVTVPGGGGGGRSTRVASPGPAVSSSPSAGGSLAYVSGRDLVIVGANGRHDVLVAPEGTLDIEPAWSTNGQWLAFLRVSESYLTHTPGDMGTLWLVRANGSDDHPVSAAGAAQYFGWDPDAAQTLAYTAPGPGESSGTVVVLPPSGPTDLVIPCHCYPTSFSWSPRGAELAIGAVNAGVGKLEVTTAGLTLGWSAWHVLATSHSYGYDLAGWWPDGDGLLYWEDEAFSASIAADGLPLASYDVSSGRTHVLGTTLIYPDWLAWSPNGGTVAVVAGGDRVVWNGAKHILLCQAQSGTCRAAPQPAETMSFDPTWTADGQLVFSRATATAAYTFGPPPGVTVTPPFAWKGVEAWTGAGELRTANDVGGEPGRSTAVAGGAGGQSPVAVTGGVLFVKAGGLWLLPTGATVATRLAASLGWWGPSDPGYYGYVPWYQAFAWHA